MAELTTHILNGLDGTHADGVRIELIHHDSSNRVFDTRTDDGGRLSVNIPADQIDTQSRYDLVIHTGEYWASRMPASEQIIDPIVLRFAMADANARYHMPVIISPHGYSTWKSG